MVQALKPGFIKIGVDPGSLSELHIKLITAAAMTHLKTRVGNCFLYGTRNSCI